MKWETVKLAECCISIADGDHQPPPKADTGVPFVTISNINASHQFDFSNTMFVPQEYYDRLDTKRRAQVGDVLYSVVGSFGIPVLITDNAPFVFQRHIAILRPNERILPAFLFYTMLSSDFYSKADAAAIGAAQRTISLNALRSMEIELPPLEIQEAIVKKLSAYDNLINNNQKQIKLLEEAAQRLYKEWFIGLRFPGHETTPILDGIPEGWIECELKDVASVNAESISKTYEYDFLDYIDLSSVSKGLILQRTKYAMPDAPGRAKRVASDGDIIWGMVRPNLKSYALVLHPSPNDVFSTGFAVLSSRAVPFSYLYCCVTQESFVGYLVNCTNGAAYPAVKPIHFEKAPMVKPSDAILNQFHRIAEPLLRKAELLDQENKKLAEARDRLLPKLMSGEIEV